MPLPVITLLSELDETTPQGDVTTIAELDDYIRQLKAFVKQFLAVAHDDRGELLEEKSELTFEDVTGTLDGNRLVANSVTASQVANKETDAGSALVRGNIADNAIGEDEIADAAVTANKIAANAVTNEKIVSVAASKITGVIATSVIPTIEDDSIEPKKIKADTNLSTDLGLLVMTNDSATHRIAKIAGALTATLTAGTPNLLTFGFAPTFDEDNGILALIGEDQINTATLTPGASRVRNGWVAGGNANWVTIGTTLLNGDKITIDRNGFYIIFLYTTVYGALASTGTIEMYSEMRNLDNDLVIKTNVVKTANELNMNIAQFGMGTVSIDTTKPNKCSFDVETFLGAGTGTWITGENGKRASIVGIIGLA